MAFLETVFEGRKDDDSGFDADVAIATGELSRFIPDLIDALGGEEESVLEGGAEAEGDVVSGGGCDDEELYEQAVTVVLDNQKASISLVQRHLRIGYNQAARLLEKMEANGVVSPMQGDGSRKIADAVEA